MVACAFISFINGEAYTCEKKKEERKIGIHLGIFEGSHKKKQRNGEWRAEHSTRKKKQKKSPQLTVFFPKPCCVHGRRQ